VDAGLVREHLAAIVASSDDAIISKDLNGTITSWNQGAERLFGYAATEAIGRSIALIIPPDRLTEEAQVLDRIRAGERVDHFDTERVRKDGTRVNVSITVSPIRGADGRVAGASKIARDISDRRRLDRVREELLDRERAARAEAVAARERVEFLAEVSAVLVSSLDYAETLDRAVHVALPRLGDYCSVFVREDGGALRLVASGHIDPAKEPIVRDFSRRFVEQDDVVPSFAREIVRTGRPLIVPRVMDSAAAEALKTRRPELLRLADLFPAHSYIGVPLVFSGRPLGVIAFGTMADLSRREYSDADLPLVEEFARRVSLAVENARLFRQAAELNRLKDEFLATLSHELRTPLNSVVGWARLLASGKLTGDAAARAVVSIERSAQAQARIVDDILDIARGMAGHLTLDIVAFDLVAVARRAVDAIAPSAAAKQVGVELSAGAPVVVEGDIERINQVASNLLSNAVKFTPHGGRVRVEVVALDGEAELHVIDTGIGIAPAFLPHVFDKFRQGDGSFTRRYGGLGLGLAIVRRLVELHGGSIEALSEGEGKGATFVVRLPLKRPSPAGAIT